MKNQTIFVELCKQKKWLNMASITKGLYQVHLTHVADECKYIMLFWDTTDEAVVCNFWKKWSLIIKKSSSSIEFIDKTTAANKYVLLNFRRC